MSCLFLCLDICFNFSSSFLMDIYGCKIQCCNNKIGQIFDDIHTYNIIYYLARFMWIDLINTLYTHHFKYKFE